MALNTNALFTTDEAKRFLGVSGAAQDDKIEDCVNEASDLVEDAWGRVLVSPYKKVDGSWTTYFTEYHPTPEACINGSDLYPNEYPLVEAVAVYEAGTLLVANTDYLVIKHPVSLLRRISSGLPVSWPQNTSTSTYRQIELRYIAGYRRHDDTDTTVPTLPEGVKRVGRELVAWIWRQRDKREVGLSSISDSLGNQVGS